MSTDAERLLEDQRKAYKKLFDEHGRTEQALCCTKNKQGIRYTGLTRYMTAERATVLDFGCGLGDLKVWLGEKRPTYTYSGVDILEDFIFSNQQTFGPGIFKAISSPRDVTGRYDYCVLSGVFNMRTLGEAEHKALIEDTLQVLFEKVNIALAVDFLSTDVDFMHPQGHHQSPAATAEFVNSKLSRRWTLDKTYLPYEYCITVFKDVTIERPRNVYAQTAIADDLA